MLLYEKGTGLLETYVTWEDVEEELTKSLAISCRMGPNRTATHIGEGEGYLSRIALIEPDWLEDRPELPSKFCVKIVSQLPLMEYDEESAKSERMQKLYKSMHDNECTTYGIFEKYRTPELRIAKMFTSRQFSHENLSKGFLILPYYDKLSKVHIVDNMGQKDVSQVLQAIAEINCVTLRMTDNEKAKISKRMFSTVCATYFTDHHVNYMSGKVREFLGQDYPDLCDRLDAVKYEICSKEAFQTLDELCEQLGMVPLMTHGDLWSMNILWTKKGEEYCLEAVVDWQSPSLSTPAVDICSFICSVLSGEERDKNTDRILEEYYTILFKKVPGPMPFTLDQLKTSYTHIFPFHGLEILGTLVAVYDDWLRDPEMRNRLPDEKVVLEKMLQLLKDILEYYDKVRAI